MLLQMKSVVVLLTAALDMLRQVLGATIAVIFATLSRRDHRSYSRCSSIDDFLTFSEKVSLPPSLLKSPSIPYKVYVSRVMSFESTYCDTMLPPLAT